MIWFKACPRCVNGDLALAVDIFGWHALCLQCGYVKDFSSRAEGEQALDRMARRYAAVAVPA